MLAVDDVRDRSSRDEVISLRPLFSRLRTGWITVLASVIAFLAFATVYILVVRPVYRTEAVLVANADNGANLSGILGQLGGVASTLGLSVPGSNSHADEALALLDSEGFLRDFVSRHDLFAMLRESPYKYRPLGFLGAQAREPDLRIAVKRLRGVMSVRRDRITGVITIGVEWYDSAAAARLLQQLIDDANTALREVDVAEAERATQLLTAEATKTEFSEIRQALFKLIEVQLNRLTLAKVRHDYALKFIGPVYVPSEKERVWPRDALIIVTAILLGVIVGAGIVCIPRQTSRGEMRR